VLRVPLVVAQEGGQPQQPVAPGLAGRARHRAAGFWRDVDEVVGLAGGGAVGEVEPKAKLGEHGELEADEMCGGASGVLEVVQRVLQHLVNVLMRIALGQQADQRCEMRHTIDRMRGGQQ
jgi:hypothetical protein